MIKLTHAQGKTYALFGLGRSGLITARALIEGGADVVVWDDSEASRDKARHEGLNVGDLREEDWPRFDSFVLSPGVPLTHPQPPHWTVEKAKAARVEIIGDIELFCRERRHAAPGAKLIAITGTNGKSTTTALAAHVLRENGKRVEMGGNIGRPALDLILENDCFAVLECSSYQIDLAPSLDPDVGILLNLAEDHLDRHGSMDHYAEVKERLIAGVRKRGLAVVGVDDLPSAMIAGRAEAHGLRTCRISMRDRLENGIWLGGTWLHEGTPGKQRPLMDLAACPALRGAHNAQNAAAAFAAARFCGIAESEIVAAMQSFPGLKHRMQRVAKLGKVLFVNDSKATNADAASRALASYKDIFWIAGGRPKSGGISSLKGFFPIIRHAYLIGEAAAEFAKTLEGNVPVTIAGTLDRAVELAAKDALASSAGEPVILLSPACASFDQYRDFEERGEAFCAAVENLPGIERLNA